MLNCVLPKANRNGWTEHRERGFGINNDIGVVRSSERGRSGELTLKQYPWHQNRQDR